MSRRRLPGCARRRRASRPPACGLRYSLIPNGAPVVELHTGAYAEARGAGAATELERLRSAARFATSLGLEVHAGHGLTYHNVQPVAAVREIVELNIGHALIAQALFVGLPAAVREMKALMREARS